VRETTFGSVLVYYGEKSDIWGKFGARDYSSYCNNINLSKDQT